MSARVWFTSDNTPSLTAAERQVLNRAGRMILFGSTAPDLSRQDLILIRGSYRPGMSASDVVAVVERHKEPQP